MIDEDVTSLNCAGRGKSVPASASPTVLSSKAISKVLGANLLLATGVPSAWCTAGKAGVTTSKNALRNKVGAVTTVAGITTSLIIPIRIRSARGVGAALVVGSAPVLLGIGDDSISVVSKAGRNQHAKNCNGLEHGYLIKKRR